MHPFAPFRTQRTLLAPIDPAEIDAGDCGRLKGVLAGDGGEGDPNMGPATSVKRYSALSPQQHSSDMAAQKGTQKHLRNRARAEERSVPLASLRSAPVPQPFSRFFEISCCGFEISIRREEAHFVRRGSTKLIAITYASEALLNLGELLPQVGKNTQNQPVLPRRTRMSAALQPKL
jgi:hypothetical protein